MRKSTVLPAAGTRWTSTSAAEARMPSYGSLLPPT